MREEPKRLFVVACAGCHRTLMRVGRIADAESAAFEKRSTGAVSQNGFDTRPLLAEVMRCVRVAPLEPEG